MSEQPSLFPDEPPKDDYTRHPVPQACKWCGVVTRWIWSPVGRVWSCDGYTPGAPGCGLGQGSIERMATPAEVDAGHELGVAWDPVGGVPPSDTDQC